MYSNGNTFSISHSKDISCHAHFTKPIMIIMASIKQDILSINILWTITMIIKDLSHTNDSFKTLFVLWDSLNDTSSMSAMEYKTPTKYHGSLSQSLPTQCVLHSPNMLWNCIHQNIKIFPHILQMIALNSDCLDLWESLRNSGSSKYRTPQIIQSRQLVNSCTDVYAGLNQY